MDDMDGMDGMDESWLETLSLRRFFVDVVNQTNALTAYSERN
jgi:hypothetical protein